jgi:hypothetical protein
MRIRTSTGKACDSSIYLAPIDFTTFTEVDAPTKVTVAAAAITLASGDRDEDYYVTLGMDTGHFTNFTHWVDVNITAQTDNDGSVMIPWALSNSHDDLKDIDDLNGTALWINAQRQAAEAYEFEIYSLNAGTYTAVDTSSPINVNTESFLSIKRVGTTLTVGIYSSAALRLAAGVPDVDTITGAVVGTEFTYVYGLGSYNNGGGAVDISGTVKNLIL